MWGHMSPVDCPKSGWVCNLTCEAGLYFKPCHVANGVGEFPNARSGNGPARTCTEPQRSVGGGREYGEYPPFGKRTGTGPPGKGHRPAQIADRSKAPASPAGTTIRTYPRFPVWPTMGQTLQIFDWTRIPPRTACQKPVETVGKSG